MFPIVVPCFSLRTPEVTKIVLPKVLQNFKKTPNCTCWPKELKYKGFPRNIQYRTRLKGHPLFFLTFRVFRKKIFQSVPFNFFGFCGQMDVEKSQRASFSVFRHCETFFKKISGAVQESTSTI